MAERLCVVTGSRAEYGLLAPVIAALKADRDFEVQLVVTGGHLSEESENTAREITAEGHRIDAVVPLDVSNDSRVAVATSLGLGVIRVAETLGRLKPERLLLAGDRYEILAAAQAALILNIPVVHLFGGETTEGAFDEAVRHSITKMSHLHLVLHELAAQRVRQLGEDPGSVIVVGNPGLDALRTTTMLAREEIERRLDFRFRRRNLLVTFHPVTLDENGGRSEIAELLTALDQLGSDFGLVITGSNADPGGREMSQMLREFAKHRAHATFYLSLGRQLYWSVMAQVDVVVGNSSSGLTEVPSFRKATVDVGERQQGRLAPESVVHCRAQSAEIASAIERALTLDCSQVRNPYGDGHSVERIVEALKAPITRDVIRKKFHMVGC